ncbi:MAG: biotin--[acetyl-CoA-carboxylase] ligase [Pseudomonadota bacterium]
MASTAWPDGVGRIALETVDSTNQEAFRRLRAGAPAPFGVLARRQAAGRGRRGRPWGAREGDLIASLALRPRALRPSAGLAEMATLSFVAGLAVADLVAQCAPRARVQVKWPNDVLADGGKISGVLLEADEAAVVIGVGVNLVARPDAALLEPTAAPTAAVSDYGSAPAPDLAAALLARAMAARLAVWATEGFAPIRAAWLTCAARLGEPIVARLSGEEVHGRFADVDPSGALVLDTPQGVRRIAAADVFFPRAEG